MGTFEDEPEPTVTIDQMMQQIKWAVDSERERCAKVADELAMKYDIPCKCAFEIAAAIRRGES